VQQSPERRPTIRNSSPNSRRGGSLTFQYPPGGVPVCAIGFRVVRGTPPGGFLSTTARAIGRNELHPYKKDFVGQVSGRTLFTLNIIHTSYTRNLENNLNQSWYRPPTYQCTPSQSTPVPLNTSSSFLRMELSHQIINSLCRRVIHRNELHRKSR